MKKSQNNFDFKENIICKNLPEVLDDKFTSYAFSVLEDRALPDARDGLKPSQRRILVSMNDLKLYSNGSTVKCAKITGFCSATYHPHGDMVIYPAIVRLAQHWIMREPLILGQGNFGNINGKPQASQRYTGAKLSKFGEMMIEDLSEEIVRYIPNYDEKEKEPVVLPAKFPNLIVNGCSGIAVGWATNMPPHNFKEVSDVIVAYIKNPNITAEKLIKIMPGPDFPTYGKLLGQAGVLDYYKTGHGSIQLEGKYEAIKDSKGIVTIIITELPYQVSPAQLTVEIEELVKNNKISGISDLVNLTCEKTGILIEIELTKGINSDILIKNLLKNTSLRKNYSINQTVLIDGKVVPDTSLIILIKTFVDHRVQVLINKFTSEFAKNSTRINTLDGLIKVSLRIDEAIKIVRMAETPTIAQEDLLRAKIVDNEDQAKAVLAITLSQLTKLESTRLKEEIKVKKERNSWLDKVLKNQEEILQFIVKEQKELSSNFGSGRCTEIISDVKDIVTEDLVKDEQIVVFFTGDGYVRSTSINDYKVQDHGKTGTAGINKKNNREDIFEIFEVNSKDLFLFFSDIGFVYQKKAYEIPQSTKTGKGIHVSNLLSLKEEENITNILSLKTLEQDGYLTISTKKGFIKRSELKEYNSNRKNTGIIATKLDDDDKIADVIFSDGKKDIFIITTNGQYVRYPESIIPIQGRSTRGSKSMKLNKNDSLVQIFTTDKEKNPDILIVTSGGYGKRTNSIEYKSLLTRNVKGYSIIDKKTLEKSGTIVGACPVHDGDSFLILTSKGNVLRINSKNIKRTGKITNGVKIETLDDKNRAIRIFKISEIENNFEGE